MLNELQAQAAYKQTEKETATDKQIEVKVFASITNRMANADLSKPDGFPKLAEAMHENVKLWTTLMVDVASDENQLPLELRAKLLNLGEFTRKHSMKVLNGEEKVDVLVDINRAIIAGLRGITSKREAA